MVIVSMVLSGARRVSARARGAQRVWDAVNRAVMVCTAHLPAFGGIELAIQLEPRTAELVDQGGPEFEVRLEALANALEAHLEACVRPLALDSTTSIVEEVGRVRFRRGGDDSGVSISISDIGDDPVQAAMRALRPASEARSRSLAKLPEPPRLRSPPCWPRSLPLACC